MAENEGGDPPPEAEEEVLPEISGGLEWRFKPEDVREWYTLSHDEVKDKIKAKIFDPSEFSDFRRDIIVDFHLFNIVHAKSICLSYTQAAVFMSIMAMVLETMRGGRPGWLDEEKKKPVKKKGEDGEENAGDGEQKEGEDAGEELPATPPAPALPLPEPCEYPEVFRKFQDFLSAHCAPKETRFFTVQEARLIIDFVTLTFFKHFLLYQYCLVYKRELEIVRANVVLQEVLPPMPLNTAKLIPKDPPKAKMVPTQYSRAPPATKKPSKENVIPLDPALQAILDKRITEVETSVNSKIDELQKHLDS